MPAYRKHAEKGCRTALAPLLLWLLIGYAAAVPAWGQPAQAALSDSVLADSLAGPLVQGRPWSAAVGITRGGQRRIFGFGSTRADTSAPPNGATLYEIGSITKAFTGVLLAESAARGDLALSDPVARFLPDSVASPSGAAAITLQDLSTHHSGLPRLPPNLNALLHMDDPYAQYGAADLYAFLEQNGLRRTADAAYAYSNLGAGLLGHALARRADTTYAALLKARVLTPLGLHGTYVAAPNAPRGALIQGYAAPNAPTPPWHFGVLAGAGALRSTTDDVLRFLEAHLSADSLSADVPAPLAQAMQEAATPRADAGAPEMKIGLGWHLLSDEGRTLVWHNGGTGGFSSFAGFDPGTGLVLLVNGALHQEVTAAGFQLLRALTERAPSTVQPRGRQ